MKRYAVALIFGMAMLAVTLSVTHAGGTDFQSFYDSSVAWRASGDLYGGSGRPNLNPPTLAVLMAPLTWLSLEQAFWLWTVLGAIALVTAVRCATVTSPTTLLWLAAWTTVAAPSAPAWQDGQLTWVLLGLVTLAWFRTRTGHVDGWIWLGVAISVKPPLALMALLLPWPAVLISGSTAAGLSAAAALVTGIGPWREWLALSGRVVWIGSPLNLSLWGLAARAQTGQISGVGLHDVSTAWVALIVGAGAALAVTARRTTGDARWVLALLWSLLLSPAGWVYYLPLALVPAVRSWPRSRLATIAAILFCVPMPLLGVASQSTTGTVLVGAIYPVAALLAWRAWSADPTIRSSARRHAPAGRSRRSPPTRLQSSR